MQTLDAYKVPGDYDELYRMYYPYIKGYLRKLGIQPQDAPDAASYILERMVARDFLSNFDPAYRSERNGRTVQARFKTFLNASVEHYARGLRDSHKRRSSQEVLLCDREYGGEGETWRWIDAFGPVTHDDHGDLDAADLVARLRAHLATVPRRSSRDLCDLTALFDELVAQVRDRGADSIDYRAVQKRFGIGSSAAHSWVNHLRDTLRQVIPGGEDGWGQTVTA